MNNESHQPRRTQSQKIILSVVASVIGGGLGLILGGALGFALFGAIAGEVLLLIIFGTFKAE